jgi:hypothetical protein
MRERVRRMRLAQVVVELLLPDEAEAEEADVGGGRVSIGGTACRGYARTGAGRRDSTKVRECVPVQRRASLEAQRLQFGADPGHGCGRSGEALSKRGERIISRRSQRGGKSRAP